MKTFVFKVAIEPDEDKWVAYSPELKDRGGATWGETKEEALKNLQDVVRLVLEDMAECGELSSFESEMRRKRKGMKGEAITSSIIQTCMTFYLRIFV